MYGIAIIACRLSLTLRFLLSDVDSGSVNYILDVRCVIFFDHLDTSAAVLSDLIDVGSFHQPHADIGVAKAVGRSAVAFAVELQS